MIKEKAPVGSNESIINGKVPDERKRSQTQVMEGISFMRIFTSSAKLISVFRWKHREIIKLDWSEKEHLVVVLEYAW